MKVILITTLLLVSGCAHVDTRRFCAAVANKQYNDYRETTLDDPPLRPSVISDLISKCIDELR
jgi:hypothetical protein